MKTIISKTKKNKIETLLFAGFGAIAMQVSMNNGIVTDGTISIRDKVIKDIMNLLK